MNGNSTAPTMFESTYALILRSEEKQRARFEALAYILLVISGVLAMSQFGREAMTMPTSIATSPAIQVQHRA